MKKPETKTLFPALPLVFALLLMSCAPGPQNTNQSSNANGSANSNAANETTNIPKPCSATDIDTEMVKIIKDSGIEDQNKGVGSPVNRKNFKYKIMQDTGKNILIIEGGISDGKKNDPETNSEFMETVIKKVDQLVDKKCVFNAKFVKYGTIEALDAGTLMLRDVAGFDWSSCDWPNIPCPGGMCAPEC